MLMGIFEYTAVLRNLAKNSNVNFSACVKFHIENEWEICACVKLTSDGWRFFLQDFVKPQYIFGQESITLKQRSVQLHTCAIGVGDLHGNQGY